MAAAESIQTLLAERTTKPVHLGRQDNPTLSSTVGSIIVGRALRLFVTVQEGTIASASFQVFSCREQVGPTDLMLDRLTGLSLAEAAAVNEVTVHEWLEEQAGGAVSPDLLPVQNWGLEALREALRGADESTGGQLSLPEPVLDVEPELPRICRCHGVSRGQLEALRDERGFKTVQELSVASGAGTGCGTCMPDVEEILRSGQAVEAEPAQGGVLGRMAVLKQAAAALQDTLVSAAEVGVVMEPWDLGDNEVVLKVAAAADTPIQPHLNAATAALAEALGEEWRAVAL